MRKLLYIIVSPLLLLVSVNAYSQNNKGTEFWTAYMDHIAGVTGNSGSSMVLYITSDVSTTGSVDIVDGSFSQIFTVTANAVTFIPIPASAFLSAQSQFLKGIHITSVKPIAVYAHIYASSVSGATLLLPVNTMGKDYISLNYTQKSNTANSYSDFAVIATEDNTTVSITPSATLLNGAPAGTAFQINLKKGEVYQGLAATDLTGTKIQSISTVNGSCKKIAVFSGSSKIGIGCSPNSSNSLSSDNLFQQVYPTSTWGKNYVTAPLAARPYDIYRIVLSDPNTNVTLNGTALNAGQFIQGLYYEFTSQLSNVVSADKPIQVIQYSPTQGQTINCATKNGDVGDPEMIYLSPIEQGLDHVTLYSTGYYKILQSYINVVIPTAAVPSFTLDGSAYTNFKPVTNNTTYSYAQIAVSSGPQASGGGSVTSGTHTIKASAPFNAIAYGFGNTESYGYAAGTNLQDLNEYVALQNPQNGAIVLNNGCSNVSYKPEVVIPYQTTNIVWNLGNGAPVYTDNNPVIQSTTIKGTQTLYTYAYPQTANYAVGSYTVLATVFDPNADLCGSTQEIQNDFVISDPSESGFTAAAANCLGDSTVFKDATAVAAGNSIKNWLWDFGDNTTSTLQNPLHLYATAGNYAVHLTVTDNNGCTTISAAKNVHVIGKPIAGFTFSNPDCAGQNVTLIDNSTTVEGAITKWAWDFGDGADSVLLTNQPFTHIYTTPGTYSVKLIVTTDGGCTSDASIENLTINPPPAADFSLPDVCLDDAFARFADKSTIADNTGSEFTYLWDFGDANATAANNTSTLKNPQHKFTQAANYQVNLKVTSKYGCVASKTQTFTVNGSVPIADFKAENNCSGDDIVFDDLSTVNFGRITKIVWYFDWNNNPGNKEEYTIDTMPADGKYRHNYGLFSDQPTKTYNVRMDVYSGSSLSCSSTKYINLVVNANPAIALTVNGNAVANTITICQSDPAIQIIENKGMFSGNGVFSGAGISSTGLFDPKLSGTGIFTINYLFTAAVTGCTYATSIQVKVNATPKVSVGPEYTVLDGGQLNLGAIAGISTGTLKYKWTPSTGLSQDDILNPIFNPSENTEYTLTVTSDQLCSAVAKTLVNVLKAPIVPNTFTPNGDGINDTWDIKYLETYPNCTVEIFNRYGKKIYLSNGYAVAWDGRYNGEYVPVGTYYYIINPKNGRKPIAGYLTIIR